MICPSSSRKPPAPDSANGGNTGASQRNISVLWRSAVLQDRRNFLLAVNKDFHINPNAGGWLQRWQSRVSALFQLHLSGLSLWAAGWRPLCPLHPVHLHHLPPPPPPTSHQYQRRKWKRWLLLWRAPQQILVLLFTAGGGRRVRQRQCQHHPHLHQHHPPLTLCPS